jgi:voltage-gated potassium channel
MVDTRDSKSRDSNIMRVQVPPSAPKSHASTPLCSMLKIKTILKNIYSALEKPRNKYFLPVNYGLGLITIISVMAVILETVPNLKHWNPIFLIIEYIGVALFTIEYILRVYYTKNRLAYIFSFYGAIDILAIVPTYLGLTNLTFLKVARAVRVARMLRTLRLIKLTRFSDKKAGSQQVLGLNFEIYTVVLTIVIVLIGTLFYLAEEHRNAPTILHGMYWVFQVIIGDRTYPTPDTTLGTIVMIFARFTALIFFGLTIGIIGAIIRKKLTGSAKDVE